MRQYAIIRLKKDTPDIVKEKFIDVESILYLGEIPNMQGHCAICIDDVISYGWHIENFEEIPDDET